MFEKKTQDLYGVIGLGNFGFALAKKLAEAGKEVLAIDSNENKIREIHAYTENAFVVGELTKEVLQEVGIQNCDTVIVCIGEKIDTSILTVLHVVSLGVSRVIAKAISYDQGSILEKIGAEVVYPERDMAIRLANRLVTSRVMEYISLSEEIDITELRLTKKVDGMTIINSSIRKKYGLNVIAIKKDGNITIEIDPNTILNENDIIVVVGKKESIQKFEDFLIGVK